MSDQRQDLLPRDRLDGASVRRLAREGRLVGQTSGLAPGYVQGNLVILPADVAADFLRFCQRNPKPCPVIGISEPGSPHIPSLGADLDLRTDVPLYRVWRDGVLAEEPTDLEALWRPDLVAFVLGCSFSFEEALIADGLEVRNVSCGVNVPMFRTSIPCAPAGPFAGPLVVTMRPFKAADAVRAVQITSRFPAVHGAPVHLGRPDLIGIRDLARPDYGDPVPVADDEIPVFWACGVTPQAVMEAARLAFAITHAPGAMLVTDVRNSRLAAL
ncbi:putative hydro-lyase [Salinarimonas soli]|uniref:Putative hydro-lyase F0L46_18695 n=1 Tax=Salinarimonas soli TaxID=1638099 RepID=A0A5B2V7M0_9HYPH|nr:putative hydro-lyase [Salinarimonas soli]KAA2235533.1 putative hydro-lyase [Salinarimonas soli]